MDMIASQHPMEPRVALVSVYTAADNTAVIRHRVDEVVRLSTYLDAIGEVSNPVIRRAAAELCMGIADAEHDHLWDVIETNGATNSRLMRERDEARNALVNFHEAQNAALLADVERLERVIGEVMAERDAARAGLARIRALHVTYQGEPEVAKWCVADAKTWPCPTIAALVPHAD
jgi:hypothetical protein